MKATSEHVFKLLIPDSTIACTAGLGARTVAAISEVCMQ